MALLPTLAGADQLTLAEPSYATALTPVGAPGTTPMVNLRELEVLMMLLDASSSSTRQK